MSLPLRAEFRLLAAALLEEDSRLQAASSAAWEAEPCQATEAKHISCPGTRLVRLSSAFAGCAVNCGALGQLL